VPPRRPGSRAHGWSAPPPIQASGARGLGSAKLALRSWPFAGDLWHCHPISNQLFLCSLWKAEGNKGFSRCATRGDVGIFRLLGRIASEAAGWEIADTRYPVDSPEPDIILAPGGARRRYNGGIDRVAEVEAARPVLWASAVKGRVEYSPWRDA